MPVHPEVIDAIGNTPLIRLKAASEATGCEILGKAEFMNPGGSVKDRAALAIVQDAIAARRLAPRRRHRRGHRRQYRHRPRHGRLRDGFRTVIVIPETQSQEKKDMLRLFGAELVEVPAVPYANPNNYVKFSGRLAEALAKSEPERRDLGQSVRQCRQPPRPLRDDRARKSGSETGGKIDGFVCAVGSGGTLAGVGMALKERNPNVKIALADPLGAALYSYYTHRRAEGRGLLDHRGHRPGPRHRQSRRRAVDFAYQIADEEALRIVFDLVEHEGLLLGGSSGDQYRRRDPARARAWAGAAHRHDAVRLRRALRLEAVQPGRSCARRTCRFRAG